VQSLGLRAAKPRPGFYFVPPLNPGRFGGKPGPPRRPRQAPRAETPSGPKSHFGTTPRGGWCAPIAALLGHIYPIPSPTPGRGVTGGPWRPPRTAGRGLSQIQNLRHRHLKPPSGTSARARGPGVGVGVRFGDLKAAQVCLHTVVTLLLQSTKYKVQRSGVGVLSGRFGKELGGMPRKPTTRVGCAGAWDALFMGCYIVLGEGELR
jgi:hypothetical protein